MKRLIRKIFGLLLLWCLCTSLVSADTWQIPVNSTSSLSIWNWSIPAPTGEMFKIADTNGNLFGQYTFQDWSGTITTRNSTVNYSITGILTFSAPYTSSNTGSYLTNKFTGDANTLKLTVWNSSFYDTDYLYTYFNYINLNTVQKTLSYSISFTDQYQIIWGGIQGVAPLTSVPEPNSMVILGIFLTGLILFFPSKYAIRS